MPFAFSSRFVPIKSDDQFDLQFCMGCPLKQVPELETFPDQEQAMDDEKMNKSERAGA